MGGEENWDVKPAQIYETLARLQESGHIIEEMTVPTVTAPTVGCMPSPKKDRPIWRHGSTRR